MNSGDLINRINYVPKRNSFLGWSRNLQVWPRFGHTNTLGSFSSSCISNSPSHPLPRSRLDFCSARERHILQPQWCIHMLRGYLIHYFERGLNMTVLAEFRCRCAIWECSDSYTKYWNEAKIGRRLPVKIKPTNSWFYAEVVKGAARGQSRVHERERSGNWHLHDSIFSFLTAIFFHFLVWFPAAILGQSRHGVFNANKSADSTHGPVDIAPYLKLSSCQV